jgi:hypothetical protein
MPTNPDVQVLRPGDTAKPNPVTIVIVSNPALEAPWGSGAFIADPITTDQPAFDASCRYIEDSLFGDLPGESEHLLADPAIGPNVRLVSVFVTGLPAQDANSLIAQDGSSNILVARRNGFVPFLARFGQQADVAYAVSKSVSHSRASAWFTSDDDARPGVSFTLDGVTPSHRHFNLIPGTVAIHTTSTSLTALHEFGHALSSWTNGMVVDLYVDSGPGLNNRRGRPILPVFAVYQGTTMATDAARDSLGYPNGWQSYHCELLDPGRPAVMDNYWLSPNGVSEHCQHDRITRQFLLDRLRAKIAR